MITEKMEKDTKDQEKKNILANDMNSQATRLLLADGLGKDSVAIGEKANRGRRSIYKRRDLFSPTSSLVPGKARTLKRNNRLVFMSRKRMRLYSGMRTMDTCLDLR